MATVLVVDGKASVRLAIRRALDAAGHRAVAVPTWEELERQSLEGDALVVDAAALPAGEPTTGPPIPRVLVTGASPGLLPGAIHLPKPLDFSTLVEALERCLQDPVEAPTSAPSHGLVYTSAAMADLLRQIERLAPLEVPVLITGESGTGKELVARALHDAGPRSTEPFVAVNCGAIPADLVESELFGHERGSFTDASRRHRGRFEQAGRGTILLDELGELPLPLQGKLLRVLQEREFPRVGGEATIPMTARILAATNQDLRDGIGTGTFREDLYHRLAVVTLAIPPLRDRPEDLRVLVPHLLSRATVRLGTPSVRVDEAAMQQLQAHSWPGNVRELEHVLQRAAVFASHGVLDVDALPDLSPGDDAPAWENHLRDYLARRRATGAAMSRPATPPVTRFGNPRCR